MICGFPGSGFVGKLAIDHLIQELRAKHLADIYSTSFPPQILVRHDGTSDLIKNSIFYFQDSGPDPTSLLLLTGDSQPANPDSEYLLAEEILDLASKFDPRQVFTLAAYITGVFIAKLRGMRGVCLLAETSGYVVDAKSSKSLLETLLSIIGMKVDMTNLEKRAKDTEALIQTIEQQIAGRTGRMVEGAQPPSQSTSSNTGYIS